jgi:hypothetical protein
MCTEFIVLEHRIGGLEKDSETGEINYEPENYKGGLRSLNSIIIVIFCGQ